MSERFQEDENEERNKAGNCLLPLPQTSAHPPTKPPTEISRVTEHGSRALTARVINTPSTEGNRDNLMCSHECLDNDLCALYQTEADRRKQQRVSRTGLLE